ncbi:MAG: hypoxanthine phosphoribosyltransferase [Armatimonadetes bacterium]|nr:hypoxanthine phosphoribosyltransferase [Armatimonadota bacterium]NIM24950.1 hypoxanthine phosphoribosyltransferase [Armatimonadota bacterium]NIM68836.1 hypoxanthine phosphoribosyltransferase [Armatimonadota bacterium]NIM76662.1 hypoxanthine phosphoribosyltransferase [Armatimonadota bacterium]NIN07041.1 hypoxanthine phosphoribosyltransferase [Armatimonadota bacterium]
MRTTAVSKPRAKAKKKVPPYTDIDQVLISEAKIAAKVKQMAAKISRDYAGKDVVLVCVLKGAVVFLSDLMRHLTLPCIVDYVDWSSYGSSTSSSGVFRILRDLEESVESRHVLIIEDIIDTGLTLHYLKRHIQGRNPASVKVVALLDKPSRRKIEARADYCGFEVPDEFVVGYGLDYEQKYRNLPFVAVLKPEIYAGRDTPPDRA